MGNMADRMTAKAGGMADVSASLVSALFDLGADVHVALPHYRRMFHIETASLISEELRIYKNKLPNSRIHLAEDRVFYYRSEVYGDHRFENPRISLAFQREVINNIVPTVKPDLLHCNDWMTGLIPAMARRVDIPCLFTVHNIHTYETTLAAIEDSGIDAAEFWRNLFYTQMPTSYENTRNGIPVDMMASGIFASHFINTVSPAFLREIVEGRHDFVPFHLRREIAAKMDAGCAAGILNAPDASYNPATDRMLAETYDAETHAAGKLENKRLLQKKTGLLRDDNAPVFFWPSRLDPKQKGCQLLTDILYNVVSRYWDRHLQVVVVANGPYQQHFHDIAQHHGLQSRIAVCNFDESLSRLAFAASDFVMIPSLFEPCGLPQMIGAIYGSLPVAHDTGGLHDTVEQLSIDSGTGNGFLFETYDSGGLSWAIDQAMLFHGQPADVRTAHISRIMRHGLATFNHANTARRYIEIYENMLKRPLLDPF